MTPYPDQQLSIDKIFDAFSIRDRLLYQLPTGGGKTAIFSFVAKRFIEETSQKVLIVAHRDKLIKQTLDTLRTIGVTCESVVAEKKNLQHNSNTYVAMIETLKNRLENDPNFVKKIGLIIVDEAHLDYHKKIFPYFPNAKIMGVTATPISLKKIDFTKCHVCGTIHHEVTICCNYETQEYSRKFTYSEIYEHIILGETITELIKKNRLVKDLNYKVSGVNRNEFVIDSKTGDFDKKSTEGQFSNFNVVKNYREISEGKKAIVFNTSTAANLKCYEDFTAAGYDVRMIDSVNTKKNEVQGIFDWYEKTAGAILCNVDVLTAGFDEPTIECVILNFSTISLAKFLQVIGRAGRVCDVIFKPTFDVIDLGGNIDYFNEKYQNGGKWSSEYPWLDIFYGTNDKTKPKKEALESTKVCGGCGGIIARASFECEICGAVQEPIKKRAEKTSDEVAVLVDEVPLPDGYKIFKYAERNGRDLAFAYDVLIGQGVDLFLMKNVSKKLYLRSLENGKFYERMKDIFSKPMRTFAVNYKGAKLRSFDVLVKSVKKRLDKHYKISDEEQIKIRIINEL
jgi:superfamily II DNA or RNA helicase